MNLLKPLGWLLVAAQNAAQMVHRDDITLVNRARGGHLRFWRLVLLGTVLAALPICAQTTPALEETVAGHWVACHRARELA